MNNSYGGISRMRNNDTSKGLTLKKFTTPSKKTTPPMRDSRDRA